MTPPPDREIPTLTEVVHAAPAQPRPVAAVSPSPASAKAEAVLRQLEPALAELVRTELRALEPQLVERLAQALRQSLEDTLAGQDGGAGKPPH